MKAYEKAYKAYDIRGVYGEHVDTTLAYAVGRAVGRKVLEKDGAEGSVLISADVREYNNQLIYYFVKWCESVGCTNVIGVWLPVENVGGQHQYWGVASTAMYYYLNKDICTMGAQFTASHNPPQYAGMKIVDHESHLVETAVIREWVGDEYPEQPETYDEADFQRIRARVMDPQHPLRMTLRQRYEQMVSLLHQKFSSLTKHYKIVIDCSNGAGIAYEKQILLDILGQQWHTLIFLNDKADAQFQAHFSDTTNPHDYVQLVAAVKEHSADLGIMFDGDADRLGLVDNEWNVIGGDMVVAVITQNILKKLPAGQAVVYDVTSTQAIRDVIEKYQWIPVPSRVGHRFIKEKFVEHNAVFGWELSGHLFFTETWGLENTLFALYHILDELQWYASCAAMITTINPYYKPALVNYEVHNKDEILDRIKTHFAAYELDFTDGIRVNMPDFWFLVRASNTEPIIRLYSEAKNGEIWRQHIEEVNQILGV